MTSRAQPLSDSDAEADAFGRVRGRRRHGGGLPKYYAIKAVAEALDVSSRTIRRWIAHGDLVVHRIDGVVRLAELKRLVGKLPVPALGLTAKNKRFLRQFDDPNALLRLVQLPEQLWAAVKRDSKPSFRTLAKAQAAVAIAILTYMPLRLQNLSDLAFDTHLFIRAGSGAISTLELSNGEVKNKRDLAFDIPPTVAKMLVEYRDRIAPRIIGHRPTRLFVKVDGTPKGARSTARLIAFYAKRRAGIVLSPHQFRHLSAKVLLDAQPGAFETVRQLLGHKNDQTTVNAYAGIDSRRAARHHQHLIDKAIADASLSRLRRQRRYG